MSSVKNSALIKREWTSSRYPAIKLSNFLWSFAQQQNSIATPIYRKKVLGDDGGFDADGDGNNDDDGDNSEG